MTVDIDFTKIRDYDGSRNNGFEELVCQLAHLEPPIGADFFVRKEGAGGDAGVECYWKLKNDTEHGWQAKYFLGQMNPSRWSQIDESAKTALKKHPLLTKYYVCLPLDRTDSRKMGKGGEQVLSILDQWNEHVRSWERLANDKGMSVEFVFWGKHELVQRLMSDDPKYSGRILYWFNGPKLSIQHLTRCLEKARAVLGDRFTPEFHLELPIAKIFDGLSLTSVWWRRLEEHYSDWREKLPEFRGVYAKESNVDFTKFPWCDAQTLVEQFDKSLKESINSKTIIEDIALLRDRHSEVSECVEKCLRSIYEIDTEELSREQKESHRSIRSAVNNLDVGVAKLGSLLNGESMAAGFAKAILIVGDPGIGKSHLLCDVATKRLASFLPTVLFLGQHYMGGNPMEDILDTLDLKGHSYEEVLVAIDAMGEAHSTRSLILIDAINEGPHKEQWIERLAGILSDIKRFPNIAIAFSCRSTYVDYLVPSSIGPTQLVSINHAGFKGFEHQAAAIYLSQQGISKPSTPILAPEFSNPLFLKTCCAALKTEGKKSFPRGHKGVTELFTFYLDSLEKVVMRKRRLSRHDQVVQKGLDAIAGALYPDNLSGIPWDEARKLVDPLDPKSNPDETLLDTLIREGALSEDIRYDLRDGKSHGTPIIRFTYERFSDHYIAERIIRDYVEGNDIVAAFKPDKHLGGLFSNGKYYSLGGIFEALSIQIAEKFNRELLDLIPKEHWDGWIIERTFTKNLLWRSRDSFTKRTLDLLNRIPRTLYDDGILNTLLALSTEPEHPWNADLLHRNLLRMSMPERDNFWSTYVALNDYEEDGEQPETIVRTLIKWAQFGRLDDMEKERIRLCAVSLIWFTTTTNRKVRDQATKALVRMLAPNIPLLPTLINSFKDVDDLYLQERLYAVIYGVTLNNDDEKAIAEMAAIVYETIFSAGKPVPHILLRDYAGGVLEYAHWKGCLSDTIPVEAFKPPYSSDWPIDNPTKTEIDSIVEDKHSAIKSSLMGFPGDFGKYSMSCVHKWSPTPLTKEMPQTSHELKLEFAEQLNKDLKVKYLALLDEERKYEEDRTNRLLRNFEQGNLDILIDVVDPREEKEIDPREILEQEILASLNEKEKECFRWVQGLGRGGKFGAFSRKWGQRWVCKRAYKLGWTEDRFKEFEEIINRDYTRRRTLTERIGKKYQRIAFSEFLAHLADNVHYIGYSDEEGTPVKYKGPWQTLLREIDPTIWIRKNYEFNWNKVSDPDSLWWHPFFFKFAPKTREQKIEWLWSEDNLPPFKDLLVVTRMNDGSKWHVLNGFSGWNEDALDTDQTSIWQKAWYRINSCIIRKEDWDKVKEHAHGEYLISSTTLSVSTNDYQSFYRELPWHPSCPERSDDWRTPGDDSDGIVPVRHMVPVSEYEWSGGYNDLSMESTLSIYLPAAGLIEQLGLISRSGEFGVWRDQAGAEAFIDPSVREDVPSYALIRSDLLNSWLEANGYMLVWLVGGEKGVYGHQTSEFYGRKVFNGAFVSNGEEVVGDSWTNDELPRD